MKNYLTKNGGTASFKVLICAAATLAACAFGLLHFHNRVVRVALPIHPFPLPSTGIVGPVISLATNLNASGFARLKHGRFHIGESDSELTVEVPSQTKASFALDVLLEPKDQGHFVLKPNSNTVVTFTPAVIISKGSVQVARLEKLTLTGSGETATAQCRLDLVHALADVVINMIAGTGDSPRDLGWSDLKRLIAEVDVQTVGVFIRRDATFRLSEQTLVTGEGGYVRLSRVKWQSDREFAGDAEVKLPLAKGTRLSAGAIYLAPDQALLFLSGRFERRGDQDKLTLQKPERAGVALSVSGGSLHRKDGVALTITKLDVDAVDGE